MSLERLSPKNIHMLVLPLQLFLDDLQCTLMTSFISLNLKTHSIPKSKFRKTVVQNTTIITHTHTISYDYKS